jgi:phage gp46-like protein
MDSPDFFAGESDCLSSKHDVKIQNGGLAQNSDPIISAILIQLNTDANVDGERGWWGNQFMPFPIGNRLWSIIGSQKQGLTVKAEEAIREALQPLITQRLIDKVNVTVVRTIDGIEASVDIFKDDKSIFSTRLS